MSRWSADFLRIALAPGEIAILRGARRTSVHAGREATSLLPALDEALSGDVWKGTRVEVVLSQHFVRHVLTPPPGKPLSPAEETALTRASLRDIYGEAANDWVVRTMSQPPRAGIVGAAIDGAFARELDALLARRGFRGIAIRPLASLAARRASGPGDGWWVLAEPGWLSVFGSAAGCWQHIAGVPVDAAWRDALPGLLARETGSAAHPVPPVAWLQPVGLGAVSAPDDTAFSWRVLPHDAQRTGAHSLLV